MTNGLAAYTTTYGAADVTEAMSLGLVAGWGGPGQGPHLQRTCSGSTMWCVCACVAVSPWPKEGLPGPCHSWTDNWTPRFRGAELGDGRRRRGQMMAFERRGLMGI